MTVALQRVVNPIPLVYRERAEGKWGSVGEPHEKVLEYDLLKADWLPPVGSGEVADIRFTRKAESLGTAHGRYSDFDLLRFTVDVEFPGDGNGLVEIPGVERLPSRCGRHRRKVIGRSLFYLPSTVWMRSGMAIRRSGRPTACASEPCATLTGPLRRPDTPWRFTAFDSLTAT